MDRKLLPPLGRQIRMPLGFLKRLTSVPKFLLKFLEGQRLSLPLVLRGRAIGDEFHH